MLQAATASHVVITLDDVRLQRQAALNILASQSLLSIVDSAVAPIEQQDIDEKFIIHRYKIVL